LAIAGQYTASTVFPGGSSLGSLEDAPPRTGHFDALFRRFLLANLSPLRGMLAKQERPSLVNVTARKIRDMAAECHSPSGIGRAYSGYLVSYPSIGRGMVIFRDPKGHRMVTTPVRRVLGELGCDTLYVETENSVYRLTFKADADAKLPPVTADQASAAEGG
jgi:hypothetical protein